MNKATQDFNAWGNKYRSFLVAPFHITEKRQELENAFEAFIATLPEVLRPLAVEIEQNGLDSTPAWDAIGNPYIETRELEKLLDKVWALVRRLEAKTPPTEVNATPKKSRVQPDEEITVWYRKNGHKYKDRKEAVSAFVDLHDKPPKLTDSLYNRLDKDLRKRPYKSPKTTRKIR